MAKVRIGKIAPKFIGDWKSNAEYDKLDICLFEGSSYISLRNDNDNAGPPPSTTDWKRSTAIGKDMFRYTKFNEYKDFGEIL